MKRKLEEESSVKEGDGVDDSHNNVSDMVEEEEGYSSDDYIVTFAGGRKMNRNVGKRQIHESGVVPDIVALELNAQLGGPVVPLRGNYYKPLCTELSRIAIDKFNNENAQNYEFVEIVNMTAQKGGRVWYYITFNAKDAIKTFQALGWEGTGPDLEVRFYRLKKSSSHEGGSGDSNSFVVGYHERKLIAS